MQIIRNSYIITLFVSLLSGCSARKEPADNQNTASLMTGADQDEHGCKASAGYQWSAVKKKCVRLFEAGIRLAPQSAPAGMDAYLLFTSMDDDAQAEVFLPGDKVGRLLKKKGGEDAGSWSVDTLTLRQWKGIYTLVGQKGNVLYEGHILADADQGTTDGSATLGTQAMLQGSWQAVHDAKEVLLIEGPTLTVFYDGQKRVTRALAYMTHCSETVCIDRKSKYGCITTSGEFDIDCQMIVNITNTALEITQGSTSKTIHYRKHT